MERPVSVFYIYADTKQDRVLFDELEKHLKILEHSGKIAGWHKRALLAGQEIKRESDMHLTQAQMILLLISPDFISSSSYPEEMVQALKRQKEGRVKVVPILLRPTYYIYAPFAHLSFLPRDGQAITSQEKNIDEEFVKIAYEIDKLIQESFTNDPGMNVSGQVEQKEKPVSEDNVIGILDALTYGIEVRGKDTRVKKQYQNLYLLIKQKCAGNLQAEEALEEFLQEPQEWRGALKKALKNLCADLDTEIIIVANRLLEARIQPTVSKYRITNTGRIGTQIIGDHTTSTNTNNL